MSEGNTLAPYRGSMAFEAMRLHVDRSGKAPKAFMLTCGSLAMARARAQFSFNIFACAGIKVIDNTFFKSIEEGVKAAGLEVTSVPLDSRERILYPEIDFTSGTPETNPQYGLTEDDIDMDSLGVPETVTRVRVTKVIKGDAKVGDIIEVAQVGGVDKSGIVRRETSTTLLNEAKASGTAEFLLLLNEYDVVYNAINPISGVLGVDTDGHVTALKSSGESGGIGESLKEYTNAVS